LGNIGWCQLQKRTHKSAEVQFSTFSNAIPRRLRGTAWQIQLSMRAFLQEDAMKKSYLAAVFVIFMTVVSAWGAPTGAQSRKPSSTGIHDYSEFTIDWNDSNSLNQSDGLGCPDGANKVIFKVPGHFRKDFSVENLGGSDCTLKSVGRSGAVTTLIYEGQCASDNDVNFVIHQKAPPHKKAEITVDAGC
jgi:hypothetical protein